MRALACGIAAVLLLAGCSSERNFDAAGVIAELEETGTYLELGEPFQSSDESAEVHSVSFVSGAGPLDGDAHGSGAVVVLGDREAAESEFARCDSALSFVCFRIANVVLRFSNISTAEERGITESLRQIANP